ncbi:MAG TPA: hypothetical protein VHP34_00395 [Alphaproteobacteria bacterium]|nr:hypothetical protein [Alphaproteobacteria bacterium]
MSWLSDYITKRRQARAELYKDRPWMTHGYWLAVIASTLAMLYGYSRAVNYYFFTESADAAYFKNAIAEQVLAGKETLYLRDLIPYKEEFETACFVFIPIKQDPTEYIAKFKGHPVEDIPWHLRNFLILKNAETERTIIFKTPTIQTPPLPGTMLWENFLDPRVSKQQQGLQLSGSYTDSYTDHYQCSAFDKAAILVERTEKLLSSNKRHNTIKISLSALQEVAEVQQ